LFASNLFSTVGYGVFSIDSDEKSIEKITFRASSDSSLEWNGSDWTHASQTKNSQLTVDVNDFVFNKLDAPDINGYSTTETDGPYNSITKLALFGLQVKDENIVDGVNFKDLDIEDSTSGEFIAKRFNTSSYGPDYRYGRMSLKDVAGTSGSTIRIPLTTEYWNGSKFIRNEEDGLSSVLSGSHYNGEHHCYKTIWSIDTIATSKASLEGDGSVVTGNANEEESAGFLSSYLYAKQGDLNTTAREHNLFWLRLDPISPENDESEIACEGASIGQPWLMYNWRGKGDENPSTTVTFGAYRGNDRVIFKGEAGLIGSN
jgi:MSHA biogenesis protein MshQ